MSRLADIYKSEKKSGGGILSTIGKRTLEKIDPRQLFDQSGMLAAMAPTLFKKYSATSMKKEKPTLSPTAQSPLQDAKMDLIIKQNQDVITNTKISAKNSLMFPGMARDMNVMRQNMVKMVKLQGGTAATKADMFFKTAKEREAEYEVKFQKDRPVSPTPTVSKDKPEGKGGILGMLSGIIPAILSGIGALGGKVLSSIGGAISGLGSLILQGITSALSISNLMKAFGVVTEALGGILKLATMVATNPLFLAMAAITGVAALLAFLRADYDKDKARYMDLALKKKEKGSLTEDEQKELEKLERPNFRKESIRSFGFDPKTGKEVDRNITDEELNKKGQAETLKILKPGDAKEYLKAGEEFYKSEGYTKQQLELMAAGKKVDLSQPSGVTPVQKPASAPPTAPTPSSQAPYNAAKDSQAASVSAATASPPVKPTAPSQVQSSEITFKDLTRDQQNAFLMKQREKEGFKPGSLTYDLNNPGAMLYASWQKNFGGELDTTGRGVGSVKGKFAKFPTLEAGIEAQRALWSGTDGAPKSFSTLPLDKAINRWVTGNKDSDVDVNMGPQGTKISGYKNALFESIKMPAPAGDVPTMTAAAPAAPPAAVTSAVLALAPSRPSSIISDSTVALSRVKEESSSAPIVVNAPQTVNNMQQGSQAVTQYTAPSIVDSEFMRMLVSRAV
jgi:hypothetical protein